MSCMSKPSVQTMLFIAAFVAFGYFHQGGGWNQNGRFAMVRSIVEEGHFWVDSYLIYGRDQPGDRRLQRVSIQDGEFVSGKQTIVLVWRDEQNRFFPVNPSFERRARENITFGQLDNVAVDRKSTRLNSSHQISSYAVFCSKQKHRWPDR